MASIALTGVAGPSSAFKLQILFPDVTTSGWLALCSSPVWAGGDEPSSKSARRWLSVSFCLNVRPSLLSSCTNACLNLSALAVAGVEPGGEEYRLLCEALSSPNDSAKLDVAAGADKGSPVLPFRFFGTYSLSSSKVGGVCSTGDADDNSRGVLGPPSGIPLLLDFLSAGTAGGGDELSRRNSRARSFRLNFDRMAATLDFFFSVSVGLSPAPAPPRSPERFFVSLDRCVDEDRLCPDAATSANSASVGGRWRGFGMGRASSWS